MTSQTKPFDAIVIGLGAMGAATVYQLALRGKRVLGIDQFSPPHLLGSSHGETRITRQAIGEGEEYVPLVLRSHEIWREIERKTDKRLLFPVGGLIIGDPSNNAVHHNKTGFITSTILAAEKFKIAHEIIETTALRKRFPQFAVSDTEIGYYEPGAGYVRPEECIRMQLALAQASGAELIVNQKVDQVEPTSGLITVRTATANYKTEQVVVTAGPWIGDFWREEKSYFNILRQVLFWFTPKRSIDEFLPPKCPIFIWSFTQTGGDGMYGFPTIDGPNGGVKIAGEQYQVTANPDSIERAVSKDEIEYMYENYIRHRMPMLSNNCIKAVSCLYTSTPDSDFVIQRHPIHQGVIIASPCSGHGFKHSAAIGETLAELVVKGTTTIDISKFRIKSV